MPSEIILLNGPNLNLTGLREPGIYGNMSLTEYLKALEASLENRATLISHQSNYEGQLIDWIHEYGFSAAGIILNAGGLTHTSVALADAVRAVSTPVIEVHISNTAARESFRHHSFLSAAARATITGCGLHGYELAVLHLLHISVMENG